MTIQTVWINSDESMTVYMPEFPHHGEADDGLERAWRLPAYHPDPESLQPEFVEPWIPGGNKIRPDRKAQWCSALRSGQYRQIFGVESNGRGGRCALGALFSIAQPGGWDDMREWLGVSADAFAVLVWIVINMNDGRHMSFPEIADHIERNY